MGREFHVSITTVLKIGIFLLLAWVIACTTSPLGRKQLILVPDSQMDQMGAQAFMQLQSSQPIERDPKIVNYVTCVSNKVTVAARPQTSVTQWDVVVFKSNEANAFALPGGKIGVYTGILKVAKTQDQLGAIIGHEVGHVIAHHGAERVSQQTGSQLGLSALGALTKDNPNSNTLMSLLGVGVQVGVLLPFSRAQESEADLIGLTLMAKSGFDPRQSVELWKNMNASSGGKAPPQWLSTHPAGETRITTLEQNMPAAQAVYQQAKSQGAKAQCDRPDL
jgi:predicted Zn-dependent protease